MRSSCFILDSPHVEERRIKISDIYRNKEIPLPLTNIVQGSPHHHNPSSTQHCFYLSNSTLLGFYGFFFFSLLLSTSPDGQRRNQIDYILCSQRWRSSTQSAKTRPGADCGSDHELLIAKFRLKLKKVGKPLDLSGMT